MARAVRPGRAAVETSAKLSTAKRAVAKAAPAPVSNADAATQLDAFLDKYAPEIRAIGRAAIAHMTKRLPGAVSLVYDNYNALAIGFGPPERPTKAPISIALYPRWVTLFLLYGAALPDPHGLMEGKGSRVRSIRLTSADDLKDERVDALISAAVMHVGWKLDPKEKSRLAIQSVSSKQRPRRP